MFDIQKKINKLPQKVQEILRSDFASKNLDDLQEKYGLKVEQIGVITNITTQVFVGQLKVSQILETVKKQLKLPEKKAKQLSLDIVGQRLLIVDEFLKGQPTKEIKKLGGKPEDYIDFVKQYEKQVKAEVEEEKQQALQEEQEQKANEYIYKEPKEAAINESVQEASSPEQKLEEMTNIMKESVMTALTSEIIEMKVDLNNVITELLLADKSNQQTILNALAENQEQITKQELMYQQEKVEPTVANWIKDLVLNLDLQPDQPISSIQKAKYYNQSENIKKLDEEDRHKIDKLFDLYENILNFYTNSQKLPLSEIQIFPFTEGEQQAFVEKYLQPLREKQQQEQAEQKDIYDLYLGDEKEQQDLDAAKKEIEKQTNKESDKLAQRFYDDILKRDRINVFAGLKVTIENGLLDNYLATNKDFKELLQNYYKRNNLTKNLEEFTADNYTENASLDFIKYLLLQRLGLPEDEAARWAVQLANIYRQQGKATLSQMAYYDIEEKTFKWSK